MPMIRGDEIFFCESESPSNCLQFDPDFHFLHNKNRFTNLAVKINNYIKTGEVYSLKVMFDETSFEFRFLIAMDSSSQASYLIGVLDEPKSLSEVEDFICQANKILTCVVAL
jgi:hypothetical protein